MPCSSISKKFTLSTSTRLLHTTPSFHIQIQAPTVSPPCLSPPCQHPPPSPIRQPLPSGHQTPSPISQMLLPVSHQKRLAQSTLTIWSSNTILP
jgi:hypothetical protein